MSRYSSKTYGRTGARDSPSQKAFDDLLKDSRPSANKAATTGSKWGKTSFTSTRTSSTPTPMEESEPKKRKVESSSIDLFSDPFSFDDNDSPNKNNTKKLTNEEKSPSTFTQDQPKSVGKPIVVKVTRTGVTISSHSSNSSGLSEKKSDEQSAFRFVRSNRNAISYTETEEPEEEELTVRRTNVRMYGKSNKNGATKAAPKPLMSGNAKASTEENKQVTLEKTNSQKMPILTINRDRLSGGNLKKIGSTPDKTIKKKFFISSPPANAKTDLADHNYSHNRLDNTEDKVNLIEEGDMEVGADDTKLFESDNEFDFNDELDSGDPEIIFNSPKNRAIEKESDADTVPDTDMRPSSPFSISDDEIEFGSTSNASDTKSRYKASYSTSMRTLTLSKANSTGTNIRDKKLPFATYSRRTNSPQLSSISEPPTAHSSSGDTFIGKPVTIIETSRPSRSDSPASVDSSSSTSSSSAPRPGVSQLTYSRKNMDDKTGVKRVRKLLTSPKKSRAVYNIRPWSADPDGSPPPQASSAAGQNPKASVFDDFDADIDDVKPVMTKPKFRRRVTAPEMTSFNNDPVSKLEITREHKPLFTVVRHVKQAHECQEHGETQEFEDDIDYIMSGLNDDQKETLRCLSTISLVSKCAMPQFRMHLRAHGTLAKIFSALHDAPLYPTLALCTAGVMFMLSRDRLNMDLDKTSLQLMLNLLSVDSKISTERTALIEYNRMKKRIQALCESLKVEGKTKHFHLDLVEISPGKLAMETLLSLTSKKAGDWFKEELRELGGLDHIVNTVGSCSDSLDEVEIEPTVSMLDSLRKIDRCLRVLENVTLMNVDNQKFLIHYNNSQLIQAVCVALRVCENCQPFNSVAEGENGSVDKGSTGYIVFSCLLGILRVLLNVTHDNEIGCRTLGQQFNVTRTLLRCVLQVPQYICTEQRFDLLVLSLGLMINMMEHSEENRRFLTEEQAQGHYDGQSSQVQMSAISALTQFFLTRFEAAERLEAEQDKDHEQMKKAEREKNRPEPELNTEDADASGRWLESESGLEWVVIPEHERGSRNGNAGEVHENNNEDNGSQASSEDVDILPGSQEEDENFTKALHKAGRHMEDSIIAAYVALLVGVVIQHNDDLVDDIREELPDGSFCPMIKMLRKFLGFMNFTSSVSNTGGKSIIRVIKTLESL